MGDERPIRFDLDELQAAIRSIKGFWQGTSRLP
jgi:hypothetical protein